ncbi:MAG: choline dehydrogenase-like flavoprotein [Paracoccaceae bacterium]
MELNVLILAQLAEAKHAAGTCWVSDWGDPGGVVHSGLLAKGVRGLRVVDALVTLTCFRANRHMTCVKIGEWLTGHLKTEPKPENLPLGSLRGSASSDLLMFVAGQVSYGDWREVAISGGW